ncbi:MAG: hypothetical protein NUV72_02815 [Bauldia sp.]|nr:hypothetical protein [Bauldia sp.]
MTDPFAERVYGIPWATLAVIALLVAVVYIFVPTAGDATGLRWFVLRWFHTIAWVFLALAAVARSKVGGAPVEWSAPLGATGGLIYVVLMLTLVAGGR